MKIKVLLLTLSVTVLALGSCNTPSKPDQPFSFDRVEYEIKDGYTEDDLQGSPWINANIPGQVSMVEQPSVKDDFYTSANYDMFIDGEPGPFDLSSIRARDVIYSIYDGTASDYPNKALFDKTKELTSGSAASSLKNYLDNLNVSSFLASKDVFLGNCGILRLYKDNDIYRIEFNDGYTNDICGYQTITFYSYYQEYEYLNDYADNIVGGIFNALGYSNYESLAVTAREYTQKLIFVNDIQYVNYLTVNDLAINGLKSALLDAGLSLSDRINISRDYFAEVVNLYNILSSSYLSEYTTAIKAILAFEHRHVLGINAYKPISTYTSQLYYFFPDEVNLNNCSSYAASCYMAEWLLQILIEKAYLFFDGDSDVKDTVTELIEDILDTYKSMISDVKWLHDGSKEAIIKKLNKMEYTSCYSDKVKNFPTIDETGLNTWTLFDVYNAYQYTILDAAVDGMLENNTFLSSGMHYYTVNAFYSPTTNEFVILNGLLSGGFVSEDVEITYARVGTVIGHEISHAFDSSGAYFNENGQYRQTGWWEKEDMTEFKARVKSLRKFWNKITLYNNHRVDGSRIDGEATADMGGVAVMLKLAKKIQNFDYDKFFRAYASLWKEEYYDLSRIDQDSHPYAYLRCNVTLAQFDEFVKTYHLKSGDGMYIPKNERVKIW